MCRVSRPLRCLALLALAASACSNVRPAVDGTRQCLTWKEDIAPLFSEQCVSCHSGQAPAGNYDLTSYLGVLGDGTHSSPNAVAGNAQSVLLEPLHPQNDAAMTVHSDFSGLYEKVRTWVVDCDLAYRRSFVHPGGLMNPTDPQFHGTQVKEMAWNFTVCQQCHGTDFSGGTAQTSCLTCHEQGPTSCTGCHGQPPATGAHLAHTTKGKLGKAFDCTECHIKPSVYTDVGHLFNEDGSVITGPAKITFGDLAKETLLDLPRSGPPAWDGKSCTNVYCHGGAFGDTNATNNAPVWSEKGQARCGSCHGLPPSNHAQDKCELCHPQVAMAPDTLVNTSLHLDGKVSLGDDSGTCTACHKQLDGAHDAHTTAAHRLRGPLVCADCHIVPETLNSPGHIDHPGPAQVFPSGWSGIAAAGGAMPSYDANSRTCSAVYCHGNGTLAVDTASSILRSPSWFATTIVNAECGSCHGIPPIDASHTPQMTLGTCFTCHPSTIDNTGSLIVTGSGASETSTHINGVVDVVP